MDIWPAMGHVCLPMCNYLTQNKRIVVKIDSINIFRLYMPLYDSIQVFNTYSHQYHQQISMDLWNQTADAQNAALPSCRFREESTL